MPFLATRKHWHGSMANTYRSSASLAVVCLGVLVLVHGGCGEGTGPVQAKQPLIHHHLNHAPFFKGEKFKDPREVTAKCLECHEQEAKDFMNTEHWLWVDEPVRVPGHEKPMSIGKKNLLNNFCISITGNWPACTKCHAGYGWKDQSFDFDDPKNIDCLICHDWSGGYVKGKAGIPPKSVDLAASAASVGYPKRENCSLCHSYGGGGLAVKHGDMDTSLNNPDRDIDVHMGGRDMLCIDCHSGGRHRIRGVAYSVSVNHDQGFSCSDCHTPAPHDDDRLNLHTKHIACQTCHIPKFAKMYPTKMFWDWSKAGDSTRKDNPHEYLKIKGEFVYDADVVPEYHWFNLTEKRYILGDKIDPSEVVNINTPMGDIRDMKAKIWPFKVHRAVQPYDKGNKWLAVFRSAGKGGYWHEFDWQKAIRLGAKDSGIDYSGEYGFVRTDMYWPLSHMVAPAEQALRCVDCHGEGGRMDWARLGYQGDPMMFGGRTR